MPPATADDDALGGDLAIAHQVLAERKTEAMIARVFFDWCAQHLLLIARSL